MTSGAFLYFFQGLSPKDITREWLRKSPIAEQMRDIWERSEGWRLQQHVECNSGPNGHSGIILVAGNPDEQLPGYYSAHQTWVDIGTHWLGIDSRFPPSAVSLERRKVVPGVEKELAQGGVFMLPTIRRPAAGQAIPNVACLPVVQTSGRRGEAYKMPERYAAIWELTGKLFNWQYLDVPLAESKAESLSALYDAAAVCLGVNYRVGPDELDALECLEDDDVAEIVRAAIGADEVDSIIAARNRAPQENPLTAPA